MFEEEYAEAFSGADALVLAPVFHSERLGPGNQIDRAALVRRFASVGARPAFAPDAIDEIPAILRREARPGDVLLLMSSGAFGGLPETLLETL
jgi:UDP-N-acetylmuramate: L-alanyl-gamma-D-glutamyl-meso-diaminopimelate ligase